MENNCLNLMKLLKKILISTKMVYHSRNKKNELVEEKSYEFQNLKNTINPNDLIYKYKTERRSQKDFSNYQNPIDLFMNLRDGNINPKEVLKNEVNFKSNKCNTKCSKDF